MNGYGGDVNLLHDVDMENLFFGDDDDLFDPDYDDQLDFLVSVLVTLAFTLWSSSSKDMYISNHSQDHDFSDDSDYSDASDHNKIFISLQASEASHISSFVFISAKL